MIRIERDLVRRIRQHARRQYPYECCGALIGRCENGVKKIEAVMPVDNRRTGEASRRRFLISAEDYRRLEKSAVERGSDIVGFYHSHPDHPATPSDHDRDLALPWFTYVIVSVEKGEPSEVSCWKLTDDRTRFDSEPMSHDT